MENDNSRIDAPPRDDRGPRRGSNPSGRRRAAPAPHPGVHRSSSATQHVRRPFVPPREVASVSQPLVFAHRGGRKHAPENTVPAFRRAVRRGATGIETDAFLTRDGVVVLAHDPAVRTADGRTRLISELDRAELPPHVPTLEDLLDVVTDGHDL